MSKANVVRLFAGSLIAVVAGVVLAFATVWVGFANNVFVMNGPDVVGIEGTPYAWTMVGLAFLAVFAMVGGFIAGLVSWIGSLLNTIQLEDKTWFVVLLVLGLLSFGIVAMVAYVIAGPDGTKQPVARQVHAPA